MKKVRHFGYVCVCVFVCSRTIRVCTFLTERSSKCEEGENQEREHDRQHLQLSQWRCHLQPLPQLCVDSERLMCKNLLFPHKGDIPSHALNQN